MPKAKLTNKARARAAQTALNAHASARGTPRTISVQGKMQSLLMDLRFLCAAKRIRFPSALRASDEMYLDSLFPGSTLKQLFPPQNKASKKGGAE